MDCATMSSDVIDDFQAPYGAVLVEGDDMAALSPTGFESGADAGARPAVAPICRDAASPTQPTKATFSIIEIVQAVEEMHAMSSIPSLKATSIRFSRNVGLAGGDALFVSADRSS